MTQEAPTNLTTTRRGAIAGVGLAGLAATLAACSSGGGTGSSGAPSAAPAGTAPAQSGAGTVLATTSEIPVGGGKVITSAKVVVTQPAADQFKAFSAICTHQHCLVDHVANGTIDCPCHGSRYSVSDGSIVAGPAPSPLTAQPIKVSGTSISLT